MDAPQIAQIALEKHFVVVARMVMCIITIYVNL
jgi:hypothetical protein